MFLHLFLLKQIIKHPIMLLNIFIYVSKHLDFPGLNNILAYDT